MTPGDVQGLADQASAVSTCAIVVLYHPEEDTLRRLVQSLSGQVEAICCVDNTPYAEDHEQAALPTDEHIVYLRLGDNIGLASGQNTGIRWAMQHGYTHVLMLDQDSELMPGTVAGLHAGEQRLLAQGISVAAVGPMYVDVKTQNSAAAHRYHFFRLEQIRVPAGSPELETDWLIASGTLTRCSVFEKVGLMMDELFIDSVDTEWGMRAKSMGYRSFIVPSVPMHHNVGDDFVPLLGRKVILHNATRSYYIARNYVYLLRVPHMGWRYRSNAPASIVVYLLVHSYLSRPRLARAKLLLHAIWNGFRGRTGRIR